MEKGICGTCVFLKRTESNRGECRRYPPYPEGFPVVNENSSCGEWKQVEPELVKEVPKKR